MDNENSFHRWHCTTCNKQFEHDDFILHIYTVHGIPTKTLGEAVLIKHADGREFFQDTMRWTISGLSFIEERRYARIGKDKAFWMDMESEK